MAEPVSQTDSLVVRAAELRIKELNRALLTKRQELRALQDQGRRQIRDLENERRRYQRVIRDLGGSSGGYECGECHEMLATPQARGAHRRWAHRKGA